MNKKIPIIDYSLPAGKQYFERIISSRQANNDSIGTTVAAVMADIRKNGDRALFAYTKKFDGVTISAKNVRISRNEITTQAKKVPKELRTTIKEAAKRIRAYHRKQIKTGYSMNTAEGVLRQIVRPLERVAVYIPGGHAVYPSSVLMNVIPALVAGVPEIVAVTPPRAGLDPAIAFALKLCNVTEVYRIGGAQAVAALAYGTKSIRQVDKIVGPGNGYVQAAKRIAFGTIDIDSIAGPSEVAIIADESVDPSWVALDLLAQAEHGSGDEIAVCVTENRAFAEKIAASAAEEIKKSPVRSVLEKLPASAITVFVASSRDESIALVNRMAPEHLQIMTRSPEADLKKIKNGAAVFLGTFTPVALGDYFVGTNHVLPTGGAARFASPLGVDSFIKRISVAEVSAQGLKKAAPHVSRFARAEKFVHHALSVERRI
ncbi:MAG: histidinol dehydrogenase [Chitinispirillaceae bacterium]|jgi:histidinol dehydrogenase|nr:histidinol dehydrogenase [Chitinispirillaceae bacterium]